MSAALLSTRLILPFVALRSRVGQMFDEIYGAHAKELIPLKEVFEACIYLIVVHLDRSW